jgi:hypothetical protein
MEIDKQGGHWGDSALPTHPELHTNNTAARGINCRERSPPKMRWRNGDSDWARPRLEVARLTTVKMLLLERGTLPLSPSFEGVDQPTSMNFGKVEHQEHSTSDNTATPKNKHPLVATTDRRVSPPTCCTTSMPAAATLFMRPKRTTYSFDAQHLPPCDVALTVQGFRLRSRNPPPRGWSSNNHIATFLDSRVGLPSNWQWRDRDGKGGLEAALGFGPLSRLWRADAWGRGNSRSSFILCFDNQYHERFLVAKSTS